LEPFPGGTVKQNCVSVGLPNRSQFYASRSVQAKEDAAKFVVARELSFGYLENSFFKIVSLAEGSGYKFS
jgi:hypothetical protein